MFYVPRVSLCIVLCINLVESSEIVLNSLLTAVHYVR